ncbi:hypothetical protein ACPCYX_16970 [Pseudomonas fluorescens]|uniref:hypothetical protein n=1 Tax=Pseudomonas fluorescens TaxID=294 RepID=UPI003C29E2F9
MAKKKANLPLPEVEHATSNNTLYPIDALLGGKVTVAFESMTKDHLIQLHWERPSEPGTPELPVVNGSDSGSIDIPIEISVISACVGKTVFVWYTATLNGQTQHSFKLELTVETIKPEHLPAAVFRDLIEVEGGLRLDMNYFPGNTRIGLPKWSLISAGQRLWILAVGDEHRPGKFRFEWVEQSHVVTAQEAGDFLTPFERELSRNWLAGCEDWSSVTLKVAVTFDGAPGTPPNNSLVSLLPGNGHELQHATAVLRVAEIEEYDDFESYPVKEFLRPGSVIDTRLLKFVLPESEAQGIGLHLARTEPEIIPGMVEGKTLALCCGGPVGRLRLARLLLKWKCTRIRLAYSTAGEGATFRFIGQDDQLLEERWVESGTWVHFQVTQGQLVCRIDVESSDHGSIDNLTVWHRGEVNPIEK